MLSTDDVPRCCASLVLHDRGPCDSDSDCLIAGRSPGPTCSQALDGRRPIFTGSLDQIRADVAATRALGAHALLLEVGWTPQVRGVADLLEWGERPWLLARQA